MFKYFDLKYPFCLIKPAIYAGALKQPMGTHTAAWQGLEKCCCLNQTIQACAWTLWKPPTRWYLPIVANRPQLQQTCCSWADYFSVASALICISLSRLGSEILGLYFYGCLYLWDGDQGKNFPQQKGSPPLSDLHSSAPGKPGNVGGAGQSSLGRLERWWWWTALTREQCSEVAGV